MQRAGWILITHNLEVPALGSVGQLSVMLLLGFAGIRKIHR
jgi:hypothetical protein